MKLINTQNQNGFSQIIIVVVLASGIIAGTLLVQNGVNFTPRAAEQEGLNPSEGKTKNCDNETNKEQCLSENNEICAKDTVTFCDNRSGTPQAIRKSGGYYDPSNPHQDPKSGCVFDYREVAGKKSECAKPESESGHVVYTTKDEAQKLDSDRAEEVKKNSTSSSSSGSGSASDKSTTACSVQASTTYNDAKVANNLARFYAIQKGAGGLCTPADFGVEYKDEVTVDGVKGRLMLCSSKSNPPELYWAIASYTDNSFILVPENIKTKPNIDSLEFANLQKARCKAGLDQGDICKEG